MHSSSTPPLKVPKPVEGKVIDFTRIEYGDDLRLLKCIIEQNEVASRYQHRDDFLEMEEVGIVEETLAKRFMFEMSVNGKDWYVHLSHNLRLRNMTNERYYEVLGTELTWEESVEYLHKLDKDLVACTSFVDLHPVIGLIKLNDRNEISYEKRDYISMTVKAIDPLRLAPEQQKMLIFIFKHSLLQSKSQFFFANHLNKIELTESFNGKKAILYLCTTKPMACYLPPKLPFNKGQPELSQLRYRVAVLEQDPQLERNEIAYSVKYKLKPLPGSQLQLLEKDKYIKFFKETNDQEADHVINEYNLGNLAKCLRWRRPVTLGNYTALIGRNFSSETLESIINKENQLRVESRGGVALYPSNRRLEIAENILFAVLEQVRDQGIEHGDLKASNIIKLKGSNAITIVNFAKSKRSNSSKHKKDNFGVGLVLLEFFGGKSDKNSLKAIQCNPSSVKLEAIKDLPGEKRLQIANLISGLLQQGAACWSLERCIASIRYIQFSLCNDLYVTNEAFYEKLLAAHNAALQLDWQLYDLSANILDKIQSSDFDQYKELLFQALNMVPSGHEEKIIGEFVRTLHVKAFKKLISRAQIEEMVVNGLMACQKIESGLFEASEKLLQIKHSFAGCSSQVVDKNYRLMMEEELNAIETDIEVALRRWEETPFSFDKILETTQRLIVRKKSLMERLNKISLTVSILLAAGEDAKTINPTNLKGTDKDILKKLLVQSFDNAVFMLKKDTVHLVVLAGKNNSSSPTYEAVRLTHSVLRKISFAGKCNMVLNKKLDPSDYLANANSKEVKMYEVCGELFELNDNPITFLPDKYLIVDFLNAFDPLKLTDTQLRGLTGLLHDNCMFEAGRYYGEGSHSVEHKSVRVHFSLTRTLVFNSTDECYEIQDRKIGSGAFVSGVYLSTARLNLLKNGSLELVQGQKKVIKYHPYSGWPNQQEEYLRQFSLGSIIPSLNMRSPNFVNQEGWCIGIEDYQEGELVSDIVARHTSQHEINSDELLSIARAVILAVIRVHDQGVVHNDIKGENLIYNSARKCAVAIDINLSAKEGSNRLNGTIGTAMYAAPEAILSGPGKAYSYSADYFSVGILLAKLFSANPLPTFEVYEIVKYLSYALDAFKESLQECQRLLMGDKQQAASVEMTRAQKIASIVYSIVLNNSLLTKANPNFLSNLQLFFGSANQKQDHIQALLNTVKGLESCMNTSLVYTGHAAIYLVGAKICPQRLLRNNDFSPNHEQQLLNLCTQLTLSPPAERISLPSALKILDKIIFERRVLKLPALKRKQVETAHANAYAIFERLLESQKFEINIFLASDSQLMEFIEDALFECPNTPEVIAEIVATLDVELLRNKKFSSVHEIFQILIQAESSYNKDSEILQDIHDKIYEVLSTPVDRGLMKSLLQLESDVNEVCEWSRRVNFSFDDVANLNVKRHSQAQILQRELASVLLQRDTRTSTGSSVKVTNCAQAITSSTTPSPRTPASTPALTPRKSPAKIAEQESLEYKRLRTSTDAAQAHGPR